MTTLVLNELAVTSTIVAIPFKRTPRREDPGSPLDHDRAASNVQNNPGNPLGVAGSEEETSLRHILRGA